MEIRAAKTLLMQLRRSSSSVSSGQNAFPLFKSTFFFIPERAFYSPWNNQDGAIAYFWFPDTAPNIIRYVEAIKNCLRPGGLFVNVGPLLWHFENNAPGQHGREKDSASDPVSDNNNGKGEMGSLPLCESH